MHEGYHKLNFSSIKKRGITFLKNQRQQLANYGVAVFLYRVTVKLLFVTLSLPLIVAMRMALPIVIIRLGEGNMD